MRIVLASVMIFLSGCNLTDEDEGVGHMNDASAPTVNLQVPDEMDDMRHEIARPTIIIE